MKSNIFTKPIIALGSGIAMGLTVAPVGAWFLAWFAMIPLWLIVINSPKYPKQKSKSLSPSALSPSPPPLGIGLSRNSIVLDYRASSFNLAGCTLVGKCCESHHFAWLFISLWGGILVMLGLSWSRIFSTQNPLIRITYWLGDLVCFRKNVEYPGPLWWSSLYYTQSPHNLVILHLVQISGPAAVTAGNSCS